MIDQSMEEQASLYVLDLLSGDDLEAFEKALRASPDLRLLVREVRKGAFQHARRAQGPIRMDLLNGIHERLGMDTEEIPGEILREPGPHIRWSYIWGAAAALFLVMNLALLFLLNKPTVESGALLSGAASEPDPDGLFIENTDRLSPEDVLLLRAQITRLREALSKRDQDLSSRSVALDSLKTENQEIRAYNAGWQRQYSRLAARFIPFFEPNDRMSRFTVIELVDAEAYATQAPGLGFAELAGSFLEGEGNIAGVGDVAFMGPTASGVGVQTANLVDNASGLAPAMGGDNLTFLAGTEMDINYKEKAVATSPSAVEPGGSAGFTVWRDKEQKGFLDLYNLPDANSGEAAFLWVRASELDPYVAVGYLPELDRGTGSFFYELDEPNFTPSEILITSESMDQPGAAPSDNILLRGP